MVALISAVKVDSQVRPPTSFSADVLRREMETALAATGLFTVPTVDKKELDPVIQEFIRTRRSSGRLTSAQFILSPTIESITLDERRRLAPNMRGKDLVTVAGKVSMNVIVFVAKDGSVQARLPIEVTYNGASHLEDPQENDRLSYGRDAVHGSGQSPEFVALSKEIGRAFAQRVLDQVNPVLVAQASGGRIYLTRGQDAGYQVGETLRIIRRGSEIRHPITKELLGREEQEIGQARVVEVQPKLSIAEVTQSTNAVAANDIVRELIHPEED
jgi:hypothetical protein